jgi:dipeptidyl aminopeptidase/acylaminoacyl peptidase
LSKEIFSAWLNKGYSVAAVSLPGFGDSEGEKDCCGPETISALSSVVDVMKEKYKISKLAVIGFGHGGIAARLLSAKRKDLRAVVCTNCIIDFLDLPTSIVSNIKNKDYKFDLSSREERLARSPFHVISDISAPLFIFHREGDPTVDQKFPEAFHSSMLSLGKECFLSIRKKLPGLHEARIHYFEVLEEAQEWLEQKMAL